MQDAGAHNTSASSPAGRSASAHLKNDGQWPIISLALPPRRAGHFGTLPRNVGRGISSISCAMASSTVLPSFLPFLSQVMSQLLNRFNTNHPVSLLHCFTPSLSVRAFPPLPTTPLFSTVPHRLTPLPVILRHGLPSYPYPQKALSHPIGSPPEPMTAVLGLRPPGQIARGGSVPSGAPGSPPAGPRGPPERSEHRFCPLPSAKQ